jgi:hypothetical protein
MDTLSIQREETNKNRWINPSTIIAHKEKIAELLISDVTIHEEYFFDLSGNKVKRELLARFKNMETSVWLNILCTLWGTELLMEKMLREAVSIAKSWNDVTINAYIKDIEDVNFIQKINTITQGLTVEQKKKIGFEILETPYGIINRIFLQNAKFLEAYFNVYIDDLNVENLKKNISFHTLCKLNKVNDETPNIKLDGHLSREINDGIMSQSTTNFIIKTLQCLSKKWPLNMVIEWVQDYNHVRKLVEFFKDIPWINLLFQWMSLKSEDFKNKNITL